MPQDNPENREADAAQVVGRAIQDLTAARLGRGFVPLVAILLLGLGQMLSGAGGFLLAVGAPLSAGAMLAYGLRAVQGAFGRPSRPWMSAAAVGAVVPPAFGVWVLGWEGLRRLAEAGGPGAFLKGALMAVLGVWVLRAWVQLLELQRLAATMSLGLREGGEE